MSLNYLHCIGTVYSKVHLANSETSNIFLRNKLSQLDSIPVHEIS